MGSLLKLYKIATDIAKPALVYLLMFRVNKGKEAHDRLSERMGTPSYNRPAGRVVWVHAASVGESQSALILIDAIGKKLPGISVLVTTGTVTSASLMEDRLPSFAIHQYAPLDHTNWVKNFLDHWKPDLAFWMESELWPNTLLELKARGVPTVLINARLSDKSFRHWSYVPSAAKIVIECFSLICTQTKRDESHYRSLGAQNVITTDNIKYSASPLPHDEISLSELKYAVGDRKTWVYASTHAGEEELACRVHKELREDIPDLLTIIVPRHPQRREEIAETCFDNGVKFRLRSNNNALPNDDDDIYIADTLGELGLFYSLSPIAVIGRSFSDDGGGGHNPVEAAQFGCAVLTGPNNQYQRQLYDDMRADGAVVETRTETELTMELRALIQDADMLRVLHENTKVFVARKTHVIDTVMESISSLLENMGRKNAA